MGLRFIFMLTRNDKTVADAHDHVETAISCGIRHIGFKDVGLPVDELKRLNARIQEAGATSYLEVVSLDEKSEVASARAAVDIGVDILLGGTRVDYVLPVIKRSGLKYYPFAGKISGHPSVLEGSVEEIVASVRALAGREGVDGLDLLAYRSHQDVPALMKAACAATDKPIIMAGSVETGEQIHALRDAGAAGFTIGTAALDGKYPADDTSLEGQLSAIMKDVAGLNRHISPFKTKNLTSAFAAVQDVWSPHVAGQINSMQIKLAKMSGEFVWHFHETEDELFLVHRGVLKMKFRDREEIVRPGEFIIVPHGVEHCPIALEEPCEVVLLEPGTTLNTGNVENERTRHTLESV